MKKREKYDHAVLEKKIKREELEERLRHIFFPKEKREIFVVIRFRQEDSSHFKKALDWAKNWEKYWYEGEGKWKWHYLRFEKNQAKPMKEFFDIVQNVEEVEVLIEGKRIPYGRDLWLPLFWFYLH